MEGPRFLKGFLFYDLEAGWHSVVLISVLWWGIVLWGSTAVMALAVALVTLLALFEYFALARRSARAYRFWTRAAHWCCIFVSGLRG